MEDTNKDWIFKSSTYIDSPGLFGIRKDTYLNERTQNDFTATVFTAQDAANIVAITETGEVVLVHQFRFGNQTYQYELPGGQIEVGESPLEGAKRELAEETGYTGGQWEYLGFVDSNPVYLDNKIHHFLALGVRKSAGQQLDEGENIDIRCVSTDEVRQLAQSGALRHPHAISALVRVMPLWEPLIQLDISDPHNFEE